MRRATLKEQSEMRRMGYTIRAWYKTRRGVPFHKDFRTIEEFKAFSTEVYKAGGYTEDHHMIISWEEYREMTLTPEERAEIAAVELPFEE